MRTKQDNIPVADPALPYTPLVPYSVSNKNREVLIFFKYSGIFLGLIWFITLKEIDSHMALVIVGAIFLVLVPAMVASSLMKINQLVAKNMHPLLHVQKDYFLNWMKARYNLDFTQFNDKKLTDMAAGSRDVGIVTSDRVYELKLTDATKKHEKLELCNRPRTRDDFP